MREDAKLSPRMAMQKVLTNSHKPIKKQYFKTEKCSTAKFLHLKSLVKISPLLQKIMKRVKMAKNMNQQIIIKDLRISTSDISEILSKFQGTGSVLDWPRCDYPWKFQQQRMVQKLTRTAKDQLKKTARQVMDECNLSNLASADIT